LAGWTEARPAGRAGALMLRALLVALLLVLARPAATQSPVDWDAWDRLASRVEQAIDSGDRSEADLEQMRALIIDWRARLLQAQRANSTRVATLREQIAALGPPPAEGKTEPDDVAARRKELTAELAAEQAPVLRAVEAWGRADGIVSQIDKTLRARQTTALRRLSPSPLLPSSWNAALSEGRAIWSGLWQEVRARSANKGTGSRLPLTFALLVGALLMMTWGRRWVDGLPMRLSERASDLSREAVTFFASLAQIVLPLAGVYLFARALDATGLIGTWGRPLLIALPASGAAFFAGRWVARQMFLPANAHMSPLMIPQADSDSARRQGIVLSAAVALHQLIAQAGVPLSGFRTGAADAIRPRLPFTLSEAAAGVLHLPLILLGALALWRLGSILCKAISITTLDPVPYRVKIAWLLGQGARIVAVAAPILTVIGYVAGANAALWPMAITLGLGGVVLLLQQFFADLWIILRGDEEAAEGLVPVLIGFVLLLAALPLLALVWGARASELAEFWTRIGQGISLGGVRLSPGAVLTFLAVFALGYVVTRGVQSALRTTVLPKTRIKTGAQTALVSGVGYLGIFIAAMLAIVSAGIDLSSLAIVAGALSVGIGFGLQNIVSNFVSGIILLIERPITVGDWIAVGGAQGYVRRISVRSTAIQTFDRTTIIVPNSDLITKEVTNWTRGSLSGRVIVPVSVAYGSDTRRVEEVLREIAEAQPTALVDPAPAILFTGLNTDRLEFEMRVILSDINAGSQVASEIRHQVIERFAAEGIEVPFTQVDVHVQRKQRPPSDKAAPEPPADRPSPQPGPDADADPDLDPRIAASAAGGLEAAYGDAGSDADK